MDRSRGASSVDLNPSHQKVSLPPSNSVRTNGIPFLDFPLLVDNSPLNPLLTSSPKRLDIPSLTDRHHTITERKNGSSWSGGEDYSLASVQGLLPECVAKAVRGEWLKKVGRERNSPLTRIDYARHIDPFPTPKHPLDKTTRSSESASSRDILLRAYLSHQWTPPVLESLL